MAFRIITIGFDTEKELFPDNELDTFMSIGNIMNYRVEFFMHRDKPYWSIFFEYEDQPDKNIQKVVATLNEKQKLIFESLKNWRKLKARELGLPVYIIFTNGELTELAKRIPQTYESMKSINGIGDKKIKNYGKEVIDILRSFE